MGNGPGSGDSFRVKSSLQGSKHVSQQAKDGTAMVEEQPERKGVGDHPLFGAVRTDRNQL
jgi:hypothetical protein